MEQQKVENISSDLQEPIQQEAKDDIVREEKEMKTEIKIEEMATESGHILVDHLRIEPVVTEITTEIAPIPVDIDTTVTECLNKDAEANNQPGFEVSEGIVEIVCIAETNCSDVVNSDEVILQKETVEDSLNDETQNNSLNERETQNDSISGETPNDSINEETPNVLINEEIPNDSLTEETTTFTVETKQEELQDSETVTLSADVTEHFEQIDEDANTDNAQEIEEDGNIVEENIEAHETCDPNAISIVEEIVTTSKTTTYSIEIQEQDSSDDRDCFNEKNLLMLEVVSENDSSVNVFEGSIQELEIEHAGDYDISGEHLTKEVSLSEDNKIDSNNESFEKKELDDDSSELYTTETVSVEILDETMGEDEADRKETKQNENLSVKKENHRSVIQEIVDDWIDDTNDDIPDSKNTPNDYHDSVEIELKTLLADGKLIDREEKSVKGSERVGDKISNPIKFSLKHKKTRNNTGSAAKEHFNGLENASAPGKCNVTTDENSSSIKLSETVPNDVPLHLLGRSVTNPSQDVTASKQKPQLTRAGVKVPARHLMSQIASKAEVTEVLQERIKQKQKDTERPQRGDILFVKKITQRLSSKLSAASTHGLTSRRSGASQILNISENYSNNSSEEKTADDAERIETADNRELLAILEGDVDPDWSNLKPQSVVEPSKSSEVIAETNTPAKLDPLMERELALKQLLELPTISVKKNSVKKKRTFKPAPSKASSNTNQIQDTVQSTVATVDSESTQTSSMQGTDVVPMIEVMVKSEEVPMDMEESHMEESRSGRKRKPTEKAREHEENSSKRQKVYKGKITEQKRAPKVQSAASDPPRKPELLEERVVEVKEELAVNPKPMTSRNILSKIGSAKNRMYQSKAQRMGKKLPQNITKRNMPVKKLLRQKPSTSVGNPKSVHMKSKFISSPKKYRNTIKQKVHKHLPNEVPSSDVKPKKKSNEIDKLLQDEGVVNLLYDVEQPERKRLVPITKSQTKVMDLQKVQRELKIRTKLVRNAVLRLRTSGGSPTKMSPRSKRNAMQSSSPENENRENERNKSTRSSISSSGDFIFPAKIRNAADASVIVRRHSSSSFSSTSGSPRVSIDGPDRQTEPCGSEEGPAHVTRSAKRRHSQNEKNKQSIDSTPTQKKTIVSRKKSMDVTDNEGSTSVVEKSVTPVRSTLRTENKTPETINKNIESTDIGKPSGIESGSKVVTRSNGIPSEKEVIKTKKGTKTKAAMNRAKDVVESEIEYVEEDKLSACLAEAVSALSSVEGTDSRSGSTTANRKPKTFTNTNKATEQSQPDVLDHLNNTEINLRRHGNIVQVTLTPSSNKLKNGITLQIMHELREALLTLRKDEACRVVLLTSTGTSFCEGLDLSNLIHTNREERRVHAEEMANGVKEFIKTLANFNKPIVAGIQGAAVGLGVTMLPLFDLVIASDKATFSTPYGQLGQIPEGAAILTLSQTIGNTITSELLLGGRILTASEALRAGLVTRVLWPDRFQGELIPSLRTMSEQSSQSMEATKTLLRHSLRKKLDAALESESYLLIQHWCSAECQTLIKNYLDGKDH